MVYREPPAAGTVVIVTALPEELGPLRRRARARLAEAAAGPLWLGALARQAVVLAGTGEGALRAASGLEAVLAAHAASAVIGVGVAGGLTRELRRGDVVVAREVRDEHATLDQLDGGWRTRAVAAGARPAVLLSIDRPVTGRREKAALAQALLASGCAVDLSGQPVAAAVDRESSSWARVASGRGIPCLLVRGICDAADDELPLPGAYPTPDGGIAGRCAVRLWREPRAWQAVLRTRWRRRRAAERVAALVETILRAAPARPKGAAEMMFADPASATSGHQ